MIEDSKRAEPRFKGMVHGVRTIIAEEGYRGIYRGVGPVVRIRYPSSTTGATRLIGRSCDRAPTRRFGSRPTRP